MTNVNLNQVNAMAQEIAKLLDANEENVKTRGDGKIENSVWSKFLGSENNNDRINIEKKAISISFAVDLIAARIKLVGTKAISNVLKGMGINWTPSVDVKPDKETLERIEKNKKNEAIINKKNEEIEQKRNNIKVEVNIDGNKKEMSYNDIAKQLMTFKRRMSSLGVIKDPKTGKPRYPKLSELHNYLKYWASRGETEAKIMLDEMEALLTAKHELEKKYPEIKPGYINVIKDADGNDIKFPTDGLKIITKKQEDGTLIGVIVGIDSDFIDE